MFINAEMLQIQSLCFAIVFIINGKIRSVLVMIFIRQLMFVRLFVSKLNSERK